MSFTVFLRDTPMHTRETIATQVVAVTKQLGMSDTATKICLAAIAVEVGTTNPHSGSYGWWCPANRKDPQTLEFPHDSESDDGYSSGYLQQQSPPGTAWWGGPFGQLEGARKRMTLRESARMFLERLNRLPYETLDGVGHPADWAQKVQGSAFPDRYREKGWPEALEVYSRITSTGGVVAPEFIELDYMTGGGRSKRSRPPINFLLHTQEGDPATTAEQLARYCDGSHNVSYHYTLRDRVLCDVVDTDYASWSVLDANAYTLNLCFAGSSVNLTREQWMQQYGDDIEIAAFIAVQDCRKYKIPTVVIAPPYYKAPGISDHKYVTQVLKIGNHVDVGRNFPWDVFTYYVNQYANNQEVDDMAQVPQDQWNLVFQELTKKFPSRSKYRNSDGLVDTLAGMTLNVDAMSHEALIERNALLGNAEAIALVKREADKGDKWAQLVYAKCPK